MTKNLDNWPDLCDDCIIDPPTIKVWVERRIDYSSVQFFCEPCALWHIGMGRVKILEMR